MNWKAVRHHNRLASARKAKRESRKAALARRTADAGGPIKVDELRSATHRVERPAPGGHIHERHVWTFRDRDWVLGYSDGDRWQAMSPFVSWRQDGDPSKGIPLTPGAAKWLQGELERMFPED